MAEIGNLDSFQVSESFAQSTHEMEKWSKDFKVPISKAGAVPFDRILDLAPKYPAMTLLMQTHQKTTWSNVKPPENFFSQRCDSRFIATSLGSCEKLDAVVETVEQVELERGIHTAAAAAPDDLSADFDPDALELPQSAQNLSAGQRIANAALAVRDTNDAIEYVDSRVKQFLQG